MRTYIQEVGSSHNWEPVRDRVMTEALGYQSRGWKVIPGSVKIQADPDNALTVSCILVDSSEPEYRTILST